MVITLTKMYFFYRPANDLFGSLCKVINDSLRITCRLTRILKDLELFYATSISHVQKVHGQESDFQGTINNTKIIKRPSLLHEAKLWEEKFLRTFSLCKLESTSFTLLLPFGILVVQELIYISKKIQSNMP